jgi:hypothetical protein
MYSSTLNLLSKNVDKERLKEKNYQAFLNGRSSNELLVSLELLEELERVAVLVLALLLQFAGDSILGRIKRTLELTDGCSPWRFWKYVNLKTIKTILTRTQVVTLCDQRLELNLTISSENLTTSNEKVTTFFSQILKNEETS